MIPEGSENRHQEQRIRPAPENEIRYRALALGADARALLRGRDLLPALEPDGADGSFRRLQQPVRQTSPLQYGKHEACGYGWIWGN